MKKEMKSKRLRCNGKKPKLKIVGEQELDTELCAWRLRKSTERGGPFCRHTIAVAQP